MRADAVDAVEFGDLAQQYDVMGVPRSVFNDRLALDGAVPEKVYLEALLESIRS